MMHILLVDDHPALAEGTKALIEQEGDMKVTVANSGIEALELLQKEKFDLFIYDLHMPRMNGLELVRKTILINSDTPILIFTGYDIIMHFNLLIEAGVSGFISKTASRKQLIHSIRGALMGEAALPVSLLKQLRRNVTQSTANLGDVSTVEISITEKEQTLLQLVAEGKSTKELAEIMLMSQRSVEYQLTTIFGKLHVRSRTEAVATAKQLHLIFNTDNLI
jgi:two-component system competent response regulator ComA